MTSNTRLSNLHARRIFLDRHALAETPRGPAKGGALLDLIKQLGFVQLDSINTVARAHDLILFSRRPRYRPKDLQSLYETQKGLFEHWTHDAAVIPIDYYPWWHLRRTRDADRLKRQWRDWRRGGFESQIESVLSQIQQHGPVGSSDVGRGEKRGSGGWWDWHPSKTALEYLWRSGALCVVGRKNFQKQYDLAERVLAPHHLDEELNPNLKDTVDWFCTGAMQRLGFASPGEIAAFWDCVSLQETKAWCSAQVASGTLVEIDVEGADGSLKRVLARPDIFSDPAKDSSCTNRLRVLSPFDPALRDRKRAERLFGFSYRIEIFVPEAQRKYGYYVFPILEGERIVGRIDMKAFRDRDTLIIKALWPEPRVKWGSGRIQRLEAELNRLTKLSGVSKICFEDGWLREPL